MNTFLLATLSAIALLTLATLVYVLAKKFKLPYTVALVGTGMLVAFSARFAPLSFLDDFRLTPEMLLYVFLPILLFEAAYNIQYKDFFRNVRSISALAVISLLVSAVVIGFGLQWTLGLFGIAVPLMVTFLFGALISATDPVAVLALFKELGAPKRLTLIFEGESLFNDGTALALFLVVLAAAMSFAGMETSHANLLMHGFESLGLSLGFTGSVAFFSMIVGGIGFGLIVGFLFSQLIGRLKNEEFLELALTLSLAHATFIGAEVLNHFLLPVSGVIATTVAAMVLGNYGRFKISHSVEKTMGHYWEFFAFLANSLVFILIGIMVVDLEVSWMSMALPISLAVLIVMIARAISVYGIVGILNLLKWEAPIPMSWQHLLSWGSLRGSLAIIMVLLIPENLALPGWTLEMSVRDFILAITVGCIVFTTFVKATTIFPIMKRFGMVELTEDEEVERFKGKLRMLLDAVSKLENMASNHRIPTEEIELLRSKYRLEGETIQQGLVKLFGKAKTERQTLLRQVVARHALGLERFWLKELYAHCEISERTFKTLLRKVENQSYRLEVGLPQIRPKGEKREVMLAERLSDLIPDFDTEKRQYVQDYLKARARNIVCERILKDLRQLENIDFLKTSGAVSDTVKEYETFRENSLSLRESLFASYREELLPLDSRLANKAMAQAKMRALDDLVEKGTLSHKVAGVLREEIESELFEKAA